MASSIKQALALAQKGVWSRDAGAGILAYYRRATGQWKFWSGEVRYGGSLFEHGESQTSVRRTVDTYMSSDVVK
jgi:hypothetical protein